MPFPWKKKNRVTRISQIVADLQSPKRGRSLFVETGFPTSLIDLFVKNRNRFKKSRFKKPVHSENIDLSPSPPPPPPSSPVLYPPPSSETLFHEVSSEEIPTPNPLIGENTDESAVSEAPPVEKLTSAFRSKVIIVKTLTVIVLAASVKELTVAITVSAFALLFLENALKRAVSCLKPCSNASVVDIESRFQKILFRVKENEIQQPVTVEMLNLNRCSVNDEIEAVEEEKSEELGICCELDDSLVSECKIKGKGSRSGRFKATMVKKLQKFRSRKEKKEEEKGISNNNDSYKENDVEVEDKEVIIIKSEVREDYGIAYSRESIIAGNSGYAILVMIMIVLVGLIVGRLQALVLTIGWCFLVKIVKVIWRPKKDEFQSVLDGVN